MSLKLYYLEISPPARAALLAIRNLGLDVELIQMNLQKGDHLKSEFVKLNPRHQIPVLVDGDFVLTESRAIMTYLANSRKPGSDLYPADAKKRALVDERLFFDATVVFPRNCDVIGPVYLDNVTTITQKQKDLIFESMTLLNSYLENSLWFAGDKPTIADLTILSDVTQIQACGYNTAPHANLSQWLERCKALPGYEENQKGANAIGKFFKSRVPIGF